MGNYYLSYHDIHALLKKLKIVINDEMRTNEFVVGGPKEDNNTKLKKQRSEKRKSIRGKTRKDLQTLTLKYLSIFYATACVFIVVLFF